MEEQTMARKVVSLALALGLLTTLVTPLSPTAQAGGDTQGKQEKPNQGAALHSKGSTAASASLRDELQNVVKVLRTTNKAQTNKYVCEALEFKYVNPFDVVNFFESTISREEGGIYSFLNPDGKSGFLVVICPEYQLPSLRQLARDLDRPSIASAPGSSYGFYRMRHRDISNLQLRNIVSMHMDNWGALMPDVQTNSVMIYDAKGGFDAANAKLLELDQPLRQVEMKVNIYEMDVNNDTKIGLDFEAWKNGPGKMLGVVSAQGQHLNNAYYGSASNHSNMRGTFLDYPSSFFDFLVSKGKAKTLANTRAVAATGIPAVLSAMDEFVIYAVNNSPNVVPAVAFDKVVVIPDRDVKGKIATLPGTTVRAKTGVEVSLTPTVGDETTILDANVALTNLIGYDDKGYPALDTVKQVSQVSVKNGSEVIFGGLNRITVLKDTRKAPFFGSLPVIGYLFGGETSIHKESTVVVSVSPTLLGAESNKKAEDDEIVKQIASESVTVIPAP
jgi:type II secretory pathway component GspD/PulD (secretin)